MKYHHRRAVDLGHVRYEMTDRHFGVTVTIFSAVMPIVTLASASMSSSPAMPW